MPSHKQGAFKDERWPIRWPAVCEISAALLRRESQRQRGNVFSIRVCNALSLFFGLFLIFINPAINNIIETGDNFVDSSDIG